LRLIFYSLQLELFFRESILFFFMTTRKISARHFAGLSGPIAVLALCLPWALSVSTAETTYENYTFTTLAGLPEAGQGWYDGTNGEAHFYYPAGVATDSGGNIYAADINNHTIRKISPGGEVTTLAGLAGISGTNNGTGSAARFNQPESVAVDTSGNVYVTDTANHTIRKITPAGLVTTLAGLPGTSGTNNGTGTAARFTRPNGVAVDGSNNVYVGDSYNQTIRKITPAGAVTTFAGLAGVVGTKNGTGTGARFNYPSRLAVDSRGNLYVADTQNSAIRKITPAGVVTTLAGSAGTSGTNNGTGGNARFNLPFGVALDAGANVYVADTGNHTIRKITPAGVVTTFAGLAGTAGSTNATGTAARFNTPAGITMDGNSNLYVGDTYNHLLRKITTAGVVTTLAGSASAPGSANGTGSTARFDFPAGVSIDRSGNLFLADVGNHTIRSVTSAGVVTTLAGLAGSSGTNNGTGNQARFNFPNGAAVDNDGNVYVADSGNHTIRKITAAGVVTTLAGSAGKAGTNNGTGAAARFNTPARVAVDGGGNVYVADSANHAIRIVTPAGAVTTLAGLPGSSGTNDGTGTLARFNQPFGVALDGTGNVFVADTFNHTIRRIAPAGAVTTFAGLPGTSGSADGTSNVARFNNPGAVAINSGNELFVADYSGSTIRKITLAGTVTTLAGSPGIAGNIDGTGSAARFNQPFGVTVSGNDVFVADYSNHVIRKGYPALPDVPVVDVPVGPVGTIRHLDVTNLTTVSWSWTFVRRPANSSAQLSSSTARNPTFTPDVADLYVLRFEGIDSSGLVASGFVNVTNTPAQLQIRSISMTANNVILNGDGGTPGETFSVLTTTNPALPLANWTLLPGGIFDSSGHFGFTNGVSPGVPIQVYSIRVP
jgi:sugar lactone lactonase YvrE